MLSITFVLVKMFVSWCYCLNYNNIQVLHITLGNTFFVNLGLTIVIDKLLGPESKNDISFTPSRPVLVEFLLANKEVF